MRAAARKLALLQVSRASSARPRPRAPSTRAPRAPQAIRCIAHRNVQIWLLFGVARDRTRSAPPASPDLLLPPFRTAEILLPQLLQCDAITLICVHIAWVLQALHTQFLCSLNPIPLALHSSQSGALSLRGVRVNTHCQRLLHIGTVPHDPNTYARWLAIDVSIR